MDDDAEKERRVEPTRAADLSSVDVPGKGSAVEHVTRSFHFVTWTSRYDDFSPFNDCAARIASMPIS